MLNIVLCCASGMSSSLLVQKMKRAAHEKNIDVNICAVSEHMLEGKIHQTDVILLGPQARFAKGRIESMAGGIPVEHIGVRDYGMMDGEAVLELAIDTIEKNK